MKKYISLLGILLIAGCAGTQAPADSQSEEINNNETEIISEDEMTIGEQIREAREYLKDCEADCEQAETAELKEQCLLACEMARAYTDQVDELTKDFQDKTGAELEEEMKKMYGITD